MELVDGCEFLNACTRDELQTVLEGTLEVMLEQARVIDGCRRRLDMMG